MATKTIRIDDLDGTEGADAYTFALNGQVFAIDLTEENYGRLREALAPFLDVATPQRVRRGEPSKRPPAKVIRAWAEENGHLKPGSSGRIPYPVVEAYMAAH